MVVGNERVSDGGRALRRFERLAHGGAAVDVHIAALIDRGRARRAGKDRRADGYGTDRRAQNAGTKQQQDLVRTHDTNSPR